MIDTNTPIEGVPQVLLVLGAALGSYTFIGTINALHQIYHVVMTPESSTKVTNKSNDIGHSDSADSKETTDTGNSDSTDSKESTNIRHFDSADSKESTSIRHSDSADSKESNKTLSSEESLTQTIKTLFNDETKERTVTHIKSKQFILLCASILISLLSYGLVYTRIKHDMAKSSALALAKDTEEQKNEVAGGGRFDPIEILQLQPKTANNKRKVNQAFLKMAKSIASDLTNSMDDEESKEDIQNLIKLQTAYRTLMDGTSKQNWQTYGHPSGPNRFQGKNSTFPAYEAAYESFRFYHPIMHFLDVGAIMYVLLFLAAARLVAKTSPALKNDSDMVIQTNWNMLTKAPVKVKEIPVFIYYGGRAPKDILKVRIDPSVKRIESDAFRCCKRIEHIDIPSSVNEVQSSAFRDCTSLQTVNFTSQPTMFDDSSTITELVNNSSTKTTDTQHTAETDFASVFDTQIDSVTSAFQPTIVNLKAMSMSIGPSAFRDCPNLRTIILPHNLTRIDKSTFRGCASLSTVSPLPTSLNKIGVMAFDGCATLRSVTLPASVKKIDCCAFHSCLNLEAADVPAMAEIGKHAFDGCPKLVYVPNGYSDENGRRSTWSHGVSLCQGVSLVGESDDKFINQFSNVRKSISPVTSMEDWRN